jgi:hypothetical protein
MSLLYGLCRCPAAQQRAAARQCVAVQQCEAVRAAVCGSAHSSVRTVCAIVCGSVLGSVWQCTQQRVAIRQCGRVRQCGSAPVIRHRGSAHGCVRQSARPCVAVRSTNVYTKSLRTYIGMPSYRQ